MSVKGRCFEYQVERDRDLVAVYRRHAADAPGPFLLTDILEKTVSSPSRRFWVSPRRAINIIQEMDKGNTLDDMRENKRRMFVEIHRRVRLLRRDPKFQGEPLSSLVYTIIEEQAPCFYMTPESAAVILHRIRKRKCRTSSGVKLQQ